MDWERILPILVQFGGGAVLCLVGVVAGLRSGYLDPKLPDDRRAVFMIAAGFVALLLLCCAFTFWLPTVLPEPKS